VISEKKSSGKLPSDVELRRIHLSSYEEIYEKVYKRIGKLVEKQKRADEKDDVADALEILNTAYNLIYEKLEAYDKLYKIIKRRDDLRAYISLVLGEDAIEKLENAARLKGKLKQLYISLKSELLSSGRRDLRKKSLGASSRLLSVAKRNKALLAEALEIKKEAMLFPDLKGKISVVIAGVPNSGKSTLASRISNAKVEVAEYPFTTKRAVPGRLLSEEFLDVAVLDTPGIFPRSFQEMSLPERRAVAVLRMAMGILLFLIDPTSSASVPLEQQIEMLLKLRGEVPEVKVAVNKIDSLSKEELDAVRKKVEQIPGIGDVYFISAAENIGLDTLLKDLKERARELALRSFREGGAKFGGR